MKRTVIKIDENRCNGCGQCVEGCHEGALQIIESKARMISYLYCDGLGACIGQCPLNAIELEEKEVEPYSEYAVMKRLVDKGEATIIAHLLHLKQHNEQEYFEQGLNYLNEHRIAINMSKLQDSKRTIQKPQSSSCPGSMAMQFNAKQNSNVDAAEISSQLRQWPVQLHLLSPQAGYLRNADLVLAADCTAYAYGNFHNRFIKDNIVAIACPKLDSDKQVYVEKLTEMIDEAGIRSLNVVIMQVPCCSGLFQLAFMAAERAKKKFQSEKQ
ncbi:MAG: 4Fe-4S binding protein [Bacteroidales bacterium]|jgi:ferredoxin|nr:4Fe-4S binding protein [Bacteroidales bacterium]